MPVNFVRSVAARVAADYPELKAWVKRTQWLASPTGLCHFRAQVFFDGQAYHAMVYMSHSNMLADESAVLVWRDRRPSWDIADRLANRMAKRYATMKVVA